MNAPDLASQLIAKHYDDQPYTSNAFFYASPGHIRATAHLYGVSTAPLKNARVLELGCAAGGNLLPFALSYPEAQVVGVDLSPVQIAQGQKIVEDLRIRNMQLHAMSLTDIDQDFGEFDYIIAHGVFSWVPPDVRQAMLRICRKNLAPEGIAYISYNTYPGWKAGDIVRDAMMLHSHGAQTEEEKLGRAKAMLSLLSNGLAAGNSLAPSLRGAVDKLSQQSDYYIAHEYLETFNNPCYFVEFAEVAQQAGLAYVGDAEAHTELAATYGNNVQLHHSLTALGQPKALRQQYLDFAVGRNFRKSLLVHQERAADIAISPELSRLKGLRVAGCFRKTEADANTPANTQPYANHKGRKLYTRDVSVIAVLEALTRAWPASLDMDALLIRTRKKTGIKDAATHANSVHKALETLFKMGMLYISADATPYDTAPEADNIGRLIPSFAYLSEQSKNTSFGVGRFNLWHDTVNIRLTEAEALVFSHMGENHTDVQLRTLLRDALQQGKVPGADGKLLTGQRNLDAKAQKIVNKLTDLLKRQGVSLD